MGFQRGETSPEGTDGGRGQTGCQPIPPSKGKRQYLLNSQVRKYCLLALRGRIAEASYSCDRAVKTFSTGDAIYGDRNGCNYTGMVAS